MAVWFAVFMGWEARELGIATALGAVSGGALMVEPGRGSLAVAGTVGGAFVGFLVGAVSVIAGHLAVESTRHWPARSERCWRARFAVCSAGGVFLLVAGFWMWVLAEVGSGPGSFAGGGVAVAFAVITLGCTFFLAPRSAPRSQHRTDDRPR